MSGDALPYRSAHAALNEGIGNFLSISGGLLEIPVSPGGLHQPPDRQIVLSVADEDDHDEPDEADHRY
jgi:hypothetical protein